MTPGDALIDLLIVLVAARGAAEISERIGIPTVLGEIAAGLLIGPSVLGIIPAASPFLTILGELGVILLLLSVGMEMDLAELGRVGATSLGVATVGVFLPFVGGFFVIEALGYGTNTAIFLGAALTATSVGITARAFADLRMLASTEARVVVGAAVADDVMGLIILTVVARLVEKGSVDLLAAGEVVVVALGFLTVTTVIGLALAPRLFTIVQRHARSNGAMVVLAMAFTLAFAQAAQAAELAPIVGAFVAGLSLGRARQSERIERDLAPISHLLVPVFFLQIGAQTELAAFARPSVLGLAGAMSLVAVVGKIGAGWAVRSGVGDKLLIGLGMLPRGEVGLIFATIGLKAGVLDPDLYAALILVVLVTTIITPPLISARAATIRRRAKAERSSGGAMPDGGWVEVRDRVVHLRAEPGEADTLGVALSAARSAVDATPGDELLEWLSRHPPAEVEWDAAAKASLHEVLLHGTSRSWRLLDASGVLDVALPEVAEALHTRRGDVAQLDLHSVHRFPTLERVRVFATAPTDDPKPGLEFGRLDHPDRMLIAALAYDVAADTEDPDRATRSIAQRLGYSTFEQETIVDLVDDATLLRAAAARADAFDDEAVLPLAAHIGTADALRERYLLTLAVSEATESARERIDTLYDTVADTLADPEFAEAGSFALVEQRRQAALDLTRDPYDARRVTTAPRSLVLSLEPTELVARIAMLGPSPPPKGYVRVYVSRLAPHDQMGQDDIGGSGKPTHEINVVSRDSTGLLARIAAVLSTSGMSVVDASAASWPDRTVLDTFTVRASRPPSAAEFEEGLRTSMRRPLRSEGIADLRVQIDNDSSPWHTLCTIEAADRAGLLHAVTAAFAANGVDVHNARISTTDDGRAKDRFTVSDRRGAKLDDRRRQALIESLHAGVRPRRWRRRPDAEETEASSVDHRSATPAP